MKFEDKVKKFHETTTVKAEVDTELTRITAFLNRPPNNQDTQNAIKDGHIFVKFAGTAAYLPLDLFNSKLLERKTFLEGKVSELTTELDALEEDDKIVKK